MNRTYKNRRRTRDKTLRKRCQPKYNLLRVNILDPLRTTLYARGHLGGPRPHRCFGAFVSF